uniref:RanBP2-type domain-containing protein n=1 Tax=Alexandrium monilatum TaxID=311494 RepID=A0A7S4V8R4_9DINO|mmetsp:Transcript_35575/g.110914  ORF Transcript_35575/g.110914 Transcript_35575/m.110914 type:complete len:423 (-) Transcript_35575:106-1374(-)
MFRPPFAAFRGAGAKGGKGCEEEDRSRDWYCHKCRERNFVKRAECFKCKAPKPRDVDCSAPPRPALPQSGTTLNGMVKSYNRKGFGFLMCFGIEHCQDIHYTRENLSPKLQTRDIPGQHVTFEIHRSPDGKLTALNIRPIGEAPESPSSGGGKSGGKPVGGCGGKGLGFGARAGREEEDRSRDWLCAACGERNFVKRFECFKCKATRTTGFSDAPAGGGGGEGLAEPRRAVSPHAGSRAWREVYANAGSGSSASRGRARERRRRRRKRSRSKSSSNSSSSSRAKERSRKRKRRRRSRSRSSGRSGRSESSDSETSDCRMEDTSGAAGSRGSGGAGRPQSGSDAAAVAALKLQSNGSPEVDRAKAEALEELMKLRSLETKEARMTEFRALLRKWHPDKNPERVEVATAVFQFLQKGKPVLDAK